MYVHTYMYVRGTYVRLYVRNMYVCMYHMYILYVCVCDVRLSAGSGSPLHPPVSREKMFWFLCGFPFSFAPFPVSSPPCVCLSYPDTFVESAVFPSTKISPPSAGPEEKKREKKKKKFPRAGGGGGGEWKKNVKFFFPKFLFIFFNFF